MISKTPDDIRHEYLINPFYEFLQDSSMRKEYEDLIKVFQAPTGFGKSFALANLFIPKIFESQKVKLVVYAVPNIENLDKYEFGDYARENGYYFTDKPDEVFLFLKQGKNVVFGVTHAYLCNGSQKPKINREKLIQLADQSAWFIEECHSWLGVTDIEWYKDVMGHGTPDFAGTVYKLLSRINQKTDLCFGITATPTKQHRGEVGDIKFQIMNEWCPKENRAFLTKWSKNYKQYKGFDEVSYKSSRGRINKRFEIDVNNCKSQLRQYVKDHHVKNIQTLKHLSNYDPNIKPKLTSMIICGGANNERLAVQLEEARKWLSQMLIKNGYNPSSQWIAIMTDSKKGFYNLNGDFESCSEDGIIAALNDPEEDCQFLLVNNKGKAGINVFNLTGICSLRIRDPETTDCTELSRQIIGRLSRLNSGHGSILKDEYNYDLEKMINNYCSDHGMNPNVFFETLKVANTFEFRHPTTPGGHWELSVEEFDELYTSSWSEMEQIVKEMIFSDVVCSDCPFRNNLDLFSSGSVGFANRLISV